jgi:hypothetical protein
MFSRVVALFQSIKVRVSDFLKRDPDQFIQRIYQQAVLVGQGTEALVAYMVSPTKANYREVRRLEKAADEVRRILLDELNRTFVTPIDREDISILSRDLDDVIDYSWSTINEMDILRVAPNDYLRQMAELIHDGAEELRLAVERLSDHPRVANEHAVRALATSNRMEKLYATALSDLFDITHKKIDSETVIHMMKLRESYRHMFHAAQSVNKAGNTIIDIVVKFF